MKKFTITVATLLGGLHAFAQNNHSKVYQTGDFNKAIVTERGTHASTVVQNSNAGLILNENQATVTQSDISIFNLNQSISLVEQYGNSHKTTVVQQGQNILEAFIGSNGSFVEANVANELISSQYGRGNDAKQFIEGAVANESIMSLNQNGKENTSIQIARNAIIGKGLVGQSGNQNTVFQLVEGVTNEARIDQTQDNNVAVQLITGSLSTDNLSMISQIGFANNVRIQTEGDNNNFDAIQLGNENRVTSLSGLANSFAGQFGNNNQAQLVQVGDENVFQIFQNGIGNNINGATNAGALQLGNGNTGIYSQDGSALTIVSDQYGDNNKEWVTQTGQGSISNVYQSGVTNSATILQADH